MRTLPWFVLMLLVWSAAAVSFPMQTQQVYIINNGMGNNTFQPTYNRQYSNYSQPVMIASMTRLFMNTAFKGSIVPTIQANNFGLMLTLTMNGDWNSNVEALTVSVAVMQANNNYYQTLFANLTAATNTFSIDPHYNSSNCQVQMYLLGWDNIITSKFATCAVTTAGTLTCTFQYDATTATFLYYSILIIDNVWYSTVCTSCQMGYININNAYHYFNKPQTPTYRYFYGFGYIGSNSNMVEVQDNPTMISLSALSYNMESSVGVVMMPPYDPVYVPPTVVAPPPTATPLSGGAIAGIVVGTLAGAAAIGIGIYCFKKKKDEVEQLESDLNNDDISVRTEQGVCLNCMRDPAVKLRPCGHQVLCKNCVNNVMMMVHECPMCGRHITGSVAVGAYD